jgi:N-sulfoglucosamine sulfohydrolase
MVFTQIDMKAGGDAVPMRCVQDEHYGYIYNAWSDGRHWYRNNNEGMTMKAMNEAAQTDTAIAARVKVFRYRAPEELYDLEKDPDCLHNLVDSPQHKEALEHYRQRLRVWMVRTGDPLLAAFDHRDHRDVVNATIREYTHGSRKVGKTRGPKPGRKGAGGKSAPQDLQSK